MAISEKPARLSAALMMTKDQRASSVPTDSGVLLRDPESDDWQRIDPGIEIVRGLTIDPNDSQVWYLACADGILRSTDSGRSWRQLTGWREADILRIVVDPVDSRKVYAATAWGVLSSADRGEHWVQRNRGLHEAYAKSIALDRRDPNRLLVASTSGLYESNDGEFRWNRIALDGCAVLCLEQSPAHPDCWIAGTEGRGVWLSHDNARTWVATAGPATNANIYSVAADPLRPGCFAAGGWDTGVLLSTDKGQCWIEVPGSLPSGKIMALTFDPHQEGRLWASTFEEGTFFSDNDGVNWHNAGLYGAYVFDLSFTGPMADKSVRPPGAGARLRP